MKNVFAFLLFFLLGLLFNLNAQQQAKSIIYLTEDDFKTGAYLDIIAEATQGPIDTVAPTELPVSDQHHYQDFCPDPPIFHFTEDELKTGAYLEIIARATQGTMDTVIAYQLPVSDRHHDVEICPDSPLAAHPGIRSRYPAVIFKTCGELCELTAEKCRRRD